MNKEQEESSFRRELLLLTRLNTCGWGLVIILAGIPVYCLSKPAAEN